MKRSDFGKDLVKARERRRLNGAEFAKEVRVSPTAVHKWENGVTFPGVNKWNIIADIAGINPADYRHEETGDVSINSPAAQISARGENYGAPQSSQQADSDKYETDENEQTTIPEALVMTEDVLKSKTVYRSALMSNIKAFHRAVMGEEEMKSMHERMDQLERMFEQKMNEMIRVMAGGIPEKRETKIA